MSDLLRILLIGDNEEDFYPARDILASVFGERLSLDWAKSWKSGLEIVESGSHDVYLVDYQLGETDGLELVRRMVDPGRDAPIILLTGMNTRDIGVEAMNSGAADDLHKGDPSPGLVEKSIRHSLARHQFLRAEHQAKAPLRENTEKLGSLYKTAHQFVDNVFHEFRIPLTVIREFAADTLVQAIPVVVENPSHQLN